MIYDRVGEEGLHWGLGGEFFEQFVTVEVAIGLIFAFYYGIMGFQALFCGVLGDDLACLKRKKNRAVYRRYTARLEYYFEEITQKSCNFSYYN